MDMIVRCALGQGGGDEWARESAEWAAVVAREDARVSAAVNVVVKDLAEPTRPTPTRPWWTAITGGV